MLHDTTVLLVPRLMLGAIECLLEPGSWQTSWCLILDNILGQKTVDDDGIPSSSATLHFVSH